MQFHSSPRNRARRLPDKGLPIRPEGVQAPGTKVEPGPIPVAFSTTGIRAFRPERPPLGTALGATTPNAAPLGVQARAPSATCAAPPRSRPEDCPGKGLPIPPPCKDPCNCVQEILREALNRCWPTRHAHRGRSSWVRPTWFQKRTTSRRHPDALRSARTPNSGG